MGPKLKKLKLINTKDINAVSFMAPTKIKTFLLIKK
jgi:hypothetical protein